MTTEQMRTFLVVADCLNFTKAAERLYLSQPTISVVLFQHENWL